MPAAKSGRMHAPRWSRSNAAHRKRGWSHLNKLHVQLDFCSADVNEPPNILPYQRRNDMSSEGLMMDQSEIMVQEYAGE